MKPLQMGKDMKIKHSVSSPLTKYGGTFFVKKLCMGEQTFLGKFMGGYFTWGLMVRHPRVGCKVNTTNRVLNLKNTHHTLFLWGWGFHVKSVYFFKKNLVVTCSLMKWGSFRFTYLWAKLMEKWVKALHSESERSCFKPRLQVLLVSYEYQAQWLTLCYWSCSEIVVQS